MRPRFLHWKECGVRCYALFAYSEEVRSLLYQFKGCGDVELRSIFFEHSLFLWKIRFHGYALVPVPSSASRDSARGFNQVREMFACFGLPEISAIEKLGEGKQSDLSVSERAKVGQYLRFKEDFSVKNKKILLVDDVYTTGSTARACIQLLKRHGCTKIAFLAMAKTMPKHKERGIFL